MKLWISNKLPTLYFFLGKKSMNLISFDSLFKIPNKQYRSTVPIYVSMTIILLSFLCNITTFIPEVGRYTCTLRQIMPEVRRLTYSGHNPRLCASTVTFFYNLLPLYFIYSFLYVLIIKQIFIGNNDL